MDGPRQVLFIQGAGEGTHDEWDDKLVDSLRTELGPGFDVSYPRMPAEDDPSAAAWVPAIRRAITDLEDGAVVVGHSIGGTILAHTLADEPPDRRLGAIVLLAAPFVGTGGWPGDEFELPNDLGASLPPGVPIHVFHGLDDDEIPPAHADLFAGAIPQATLHRLPGRDHQLGNDLSDVADVIRDLPHSPAAPG
jgi:pimeloyl-ACP methyl ester carboxylesterase